VVAVLIDLFSYVHRLDRESSGLLLMGRTKESVDHLQWLFSDINKGNPSCKVLMPTLLIALGPAGAVNANSRTQQ
jgi:hypothetical protein